MATTVSEHRDSRERTCDKAGHKTVRRILLVNFGNDTDPVGWTQHLAEDAIIAAGYTCNSSPPEDADVYLDKIAVRRGGIRGEKADHIFHALLEYSSWDPQRRNINDETVDVDMAGQGESEEYDTANNRLDEGLSDPPLAVSKDVPMATIRVKRVHSTSKLGTWESFGCCLNNDTVVTPGGRTLTVVQGKLRFVGAPERQIDKDRFEIVYTFLLDCARMNSDAGPVDRLHRVPITVELADGTKKFLGLKDLYETAALSGCMADE